ncbi:MAG: hypothetical protein ACYCPP_07955 [Nitrososphaerales archaeon]
MSVSQFVDSTPVIEISIQNPFLQQFYPSTIEKGRETKAGIMAVLDTGYDGFLMLPGRLFRKLAFHKLGTQRTKASLANGKWIDLIGAFGTVSFPSLNGLMVNGRIETGKGQSEILIGMDGIRSLLIELDCCKETLKAQKCIS